MHARANAFACARRLGAACRLDPAAALLFRTESNGAVESPMPSLPSHSETTGRKRGEAEALPTSGGP